MLPRLWKHDQGLEMRAQGKSASFKWPMQGLLPLTLLQIKPGPKDIKCQKVEGLHKPQ